MVNILIMLGVWVALSVALSPLIGWMISEINRQADR